MWIYLDWSFASKQLLEELCFTEQHVSALWGKTHAFLSMQISEQISPNESKESLRPRPKAVGPGPRPWTQHVSPRTGWMTWAYSQRRLVQKSKE